MRSISLFIILASSCWAITVPLSERLRAKSLLPRVDNQQLSNPDHEPPYVEPLTGNVVEKSKMLSGIGPGAATNRFFDWDESCDDEDDRRKIYQTWENFQDLTQTTLRQLSALRDNLPHPPADQGKANSNNQAFIRQEDPAYTQMFKARDTGLHDVQRAFQSIIDNVKNYPGKGGGDPPALRFICNKNNHVKYADGTPFCGNGDTASQAQTMVPQDPGGEEIEPKYSLERSSSITFCPVFFDDVKFPSIEVIVGDPDANQMTLEDVDSRERVMLHEYLHLPWTRNMQPPPYEDHIGYYKAAEYCAKNAWPAVMQLPDCFAWYVLYSYFNNKQKCCGRDIWPPGVRKPIRPN